jgi:hypothetical protein
MESQTSLVINQQSKQPSNVIEASTLTITWNAKHLLVINQQSKHLSNVIEASTLTITWNAKHLLLITDAGS